MFLFFSVVDKEGYDWTGLWALCSRSWVM